jgi:peptide/nickel transport system permease protein
MRKTVRHFARNRLAVAGLLVLVVQMIVIVIVPWIAPYSPRTQIPGATFLTPGSPGHVLGTDDVGRDVLSRILYGTRLTYVIGFSILAIALAGGVPLGIAAGFYPRLDNVLMRVLEVVQALPSLLLALILTLFLGRGIVSVIVAVGVVSIPMFARLMRGAVLALRSSEYVQAAKAVGASDLRVMTRHLLPNTLPVLLVQSTFLMATGILSAAALGFLGVGVQPPEAEWGSMLGRGRAFLQIYPHISLFPGLAIFVTVLGLNLVGDGLRDALDPRLKITPTGGS